MSTNKNHAMRSKRSSHNSKPFMMFIRNAFDKQNDTRMISIVIDIADYLGVPVIAEGVETEEQYLALKKLGCTIIQGYYFSKPVPAEEFEKFLVENNA